MHHEDVPSCHVCQMQLTKVASEVVELERQGITERVRMEIDKTSYSIEQSTKKLTALKQEKEQKSPLASQEKGLKEALDEGNEKQAALKKDLSTVKGKLEKTTKKLNELNTDVAKLEDEIKILKQEENGWDNEVKTSRQFKAKVLVLESNIKKLEDKITKLEADYNELHKAGSGFGILFSTWKSKIAALQIKYPGVKSDDMESRLLQEIDAKKKNKSNEKAEKSRRFGANTSADFNARAEDADQKKVVISDEIKRITGPKNEKSVLVKNLNIDQKALQEENDRLTQEIDKLILENEKLETDLSESSAAVKELREIDKQIKKLETTQAKEIQELRILELKQNVYH